MVAPNRIVAPNVIRRRRRLISWAFFIPANFSNVAVGAQQSVSSKLDAETDFVVLGLHLGVYFNSSVNLTTAAGISALATNNGTMQKLYRQAAVNAATLTNGHLGHMTLKISNNDRLWMPDEVRADLLTGEPGNVFLLPEPILLPANSTVLATLKNNLPASIGGASSPPIDAQLLYVGRKQKWVVDE